VASEGKLSNRRIALVIAEGYHEHEFWFPYYRFLEEGSEVVVAGPEVGTVRGEGPAGRNGLARTFHDLLTSGGAFRPSAVFSARAILGVS